jgi:hypothetical protein
MSVAINDSTPNPAKTLPHERPPRKRSKDRLRGTRLVLSLVVLVIAALMASTSYSEAGSILQFKPPYSHLVPSHANSIGGAKSCGIGRYTSTPTAYPNRGAITLGATAGLAVGNRHCKVIDSVTTHQGFQGPNFTALSNQTDTISIKWVMSGSASITMQGSGRIRSAHLSVVLEGNLFDNTTHKWVLGGSSPVSPTATVLNQTNRTNSTANWNVTLTDDVTWVNFSAAVNGGNQYLLFTALDTELSAEQNVSCGLRNHFTGACLAYNVVASRCVLDLGSGTNGARVTLMRVS